MWSMWSNEPPPDDDGEEQAREEYERDLEEREQELFAQGSIDADERAPWPGEARDDALDPACAAGRSNRG